MSASVNFLKILKISHNSVFFPLFFRFLFLSHHYFFYFSPSVFVSFSCFYIFCLNFSLSLCAFIFRLLYPCLFVVLYLPRSMSSFLLSPRLRFYVSLLRSESAITSLPLSRLYTTFAPPANYGLV